MTIGERIKAEMRAKTPPADVKQLARATGLATSTIYDLLRGDSASTTKLHAVADFLGVRPHWLETGQGPKHPTPDTAATAASRLGVFAHDPADPLPESLVQIKVSSVRFSGGNGHVTTHCDIEEESEPHTYQRSWFVREKLVPDRCRRFRVIGRSQEPFLYSGDWILVNLDETRVEDGRYYAFRYGDELRIKKLYRRLNGGLLLISENAVEYPAEEVAPADVAHHITIIGRVRDKGGRGGL